MSQFDEWCGNEKFTEVILKRDFARLLLSDHVENPGLSKEGCKINRHAVLHQVIKTKTNKGVSFYEAMHDETLRNKYLEIQKRYKRTVYQGFQLWTGCVNLFRPAMAKWLYKRYEAKVGVLDFSAGWGGRCLGALALGVPYHGIDTNIDLVDAYGEMIQKYNHKNVRVSMTWAPSETVDFAQFDYDMIMTSPPYYKLERYNHMPEYKSPKDFYDRFLIPVVTKAFKHLRVGGHMALNMPESMYLAVKDHLPPIVETVEYAKHQRCAGLKMDRAMPATHELIYVWRKGAEMDEVIASPEATPLVEVRKSSVHGVGLFATKRIRKGHCLGPFQGVEMTMAEFKAKYGKDTRFSYSLRRQNKIIDGKGVDNLSNYCNESNTPNVCFKKRGLWTTRAIEPDEELCLKYPRFYPREYTL